MPDQAGDSCTVQYISGGRGGSGGPGGETGGAGGLGGGTTLESQYDIHANSVNLNNHWHFNLDRETLVSIAQWQIVDAGGRARFGLHPAGGTLDDFSEDAQVHMPTPSCDGQAPVPLPLRKATFDSLIQERLATDHVHPVFPLPSYDTPPPIPQIMRNATFDSLVHERLAADSAPIPFPLPLSPSSIGSSMLEVPTAHYTDPPSPPPPAPSSFPPILGPAPHIPPTRPARSLFSRLRLRRKPKPSLSSAVSCVMGAAVVPWINSSATSTSTPSHASNSSTSSHSFL